MAVHLMFAEQLGLQPRIRGQVDQAEQNGGGREDHRRRRVVVLLAVVLTDAQIDHITGLLSLRDGPPIHLYATPAVFEELSHNLPVLPMLEHYCGVHWHVIPVAGECREASFRVDGLPGIEFTAKAQQGDPDILARLKADPNLMSYGGGIPLKVGDEIIGAIGVGGAPGADKDDVCALAGVAKVKDRL